jgi:ABC-2 type transport system permease protein
MMSAVVQTLSHPTFASNLRALWMIAAKDWKQYWRYPLNAVSQVMNPLIFLSPVYFLGQAFSVNGQAKGFEAFSGTSDYISFILLGTVLNNFIMTVFWGIGYALKNDMDAGVLESNWLMPISRPLLLVGRTLTSLLITIITSLGMLLIAGLLFGFHPTGSALLALVPVFPMLIGLYGFGLAFGAVVLLMRDANTLVDVSSYLVGLFSGSQFPVQSLPGFLMPISLAIPLTYGFDAVRAILIKTQTIIPVPYEIALLFVFMFLMIWFGLRVFDSMERKVRTRGTLGQH